MRRRRLRLRLWRLRLRLWLLRPRPQADRPECRRCFLHPRWKWLEVQGALFLAVVVAERAAVLRLLA
jgi:hypothetical protein